MDRSERRRRTRNVLRRRIKELKLWGMLGIWKDERAEMRRIGFCRKRKPLDCGKSRCYICDKGRMHGITRQEEEVLLRFTEEMNDVENN